MAKKEKLHNLRILEIMTAKKMTYADIAEKINEAYMKEALDNGLKPEEARTITTSSVSARCNGNPSLSNLYDIANALGVKITELFPEEDQYRGGVVHASVKGSIFCPACGQQFTLL